MQMAENLLPDFMQEKGQWQWEESVDKKAGFWLAKKE